LQKGGTLIAEDVLDRETHRRRLCDPDGYRLAACLHCGGNVLHVHDYVERVAYGELHRELVVRYRCMSDGCGATWRVLPAFLARHLWYAWRTVEASTMPASSSPPAPPAITGPPPRCPVQRTVTRWLERLVASARILMQLFASVGTAALAAMTAPLGLDATRHQLVVAYETTMGIAPGRRLSALAGHVHRLAPGLRLM
jgi:hypothetical protein